MVTCFVFVSANFPESVVDRLPAAVGTGVYFGYARVDQGPVHSMVMSIGWNPFYKNDRKSMASRFGSVSNAAARECSTIDHPAH